MIKKIFFSYIFLTCIIELNAQVTMNNQDGALTKKEKLYVERGILYQANFFKKAFSDSSIRLTGTQIIIFDNQLDFIDYGLTDGKDVDVCCSGYIDPSTKKIVIYRRDRKDFFCSYFRVFYGRSHFFLNETMPNPATWLSEGLSIYFGTMNISTKAVRFKKNKSYNTALKKMVAQKNVDIANLITWDNDRFQQMYSQGYDGYTVAYGIVWLLLQKDENILFKMMRDMRNGQSSTAVFDLHYPGGLAQFQKDFLTYYK